MVSSRARLFGGRRQRAQTVVQGVQTGQSFRIQVG
jgi:hypothetical protein